MEPVSGSELVRRWQVVMERVTQDETDATFRIPPTIDAYEKLSSSTPYASLLQQWASTCSGAKRRRHADQGRGWRGGLRRGEPALNTHLIRKIQSSLSLYAQAIKGASSYAHHVQDCASTRCPASRPL